MHVAALVPPAWFATRAQASLFAVLYALWLACEIVIRLLSLRRGKGERSGDRGSYSVVALGVAASVAFSYVSRGAWPGFGLLPAWCFWLGAALMLAGMALRVWAVVTLGRFFNVVVTIRSDHRLVTSGPYRLLRHPSYSGVLLILLGLPLGLRAGLGLLALLLVIPLFGYRMRVEERAMLERFGEEYADFMRRRRRLIPFVY